MSAKSQHQHILLVAAGITLVVVLVGVIGMLALRSEEPTIQGEVEVSEYRVSSKLPGRILELRVKEGDYVHKGDTLAILEVPEVDAQKKVAQATGEATQAMSDLADAGARKEQIQAAYQLVQQAKAANEIAQKTYHRLQNLYNEGVVSGQKRDEAFAAYKATEAQVLAAESQYQMAKNGARMQERRMAQKQAQAAAEAVEVVNSLLRETVQISQTDGEVSEVYPRIGELVGLGSPIMSIAQMDDVWGSFNVREDQLQGMKVGDVMEAYCPAFNKTLQMKVCSIKDQGSYAVWKATKANGQYDVKTFEVKARPVAPFDGLRPGMSLIVGGKPK